MASPMSVPPWPEPVDLASAPEGTESVWVWLGAAEEAGRAQGLLGEAGPEHFGFDLVLGPQVRDKRVGLALRAERAGQLI